MLELLVVDHEPDAALLTAGMLERHGLATRIAVTGEDALELIARVGFAAVVVEVELGRGVSGLEVCRRGLGRSASTPFIVLTAARGVEVAAGALRAGAFDFVCKPVVASELVPVVMRAIEHRARSAPLHGQRDHAIEGLIGVSTALRRVEELVHRVAPSDVTVLITGESGTGKERICRAVHELSGRSSKPFVAVNCAAISMHLLESELFGHVRGAFTDAGDNRPGLFVRADGGTLLLDEIGELPLELQPKLLRALQSRAVRPVGSDREIPIACRVLCATNRDLHAEVLAGRFRDDLFYRVNVVEIPVPPLRERGADVVLLAVHFLTRWAERNGRRVPQLDEAARRLLLDYHWPGNVRELENSVERAVAVSQGGAITPDMLPPKIRQHQSGRMVDVDASIGSFITLAELEMRYIQKVLTATRNNKTRAAQLLGIDRRSLHRRLATASQEIPMIRKGPDDGPEEHRADDPLPRLGTAPHREDRDP